MTRVGSGAGIHTGRRPAGRRRHRVRGLAGAAAAAVLLAVSGCGAGKNAETAREVAAVPGAEAQAGPIALRDLLIPFRPGGYPAGSDAALVVRIFSNAERPITLIAVDPGTHGVMTVQSKAVRLRSSATAVPHGVTRASGLTMAPGQDLLLVPGSGPYLVADHLAAPLPYGANVPIRFTFSTGDTVNVDIPMAPPPQ